MDPVKFDPNAPFEPVGDVLFDPSQPFEEVGDSLEEEPQEAPPVQAPAQPGPSVSVAPAPAQQTAPVFDPTQSYEAVSDPVVQQDVQNVGGFGMDRAFEAERPNPLTEDEATTYVALVQDLNVPEAEIATFLENRGAVWTPQASAELAEYRRAIESGQEVGTDVSYKPLTREIMGRYLPEFNPDSGDSDFELAFEGGQVNNPLGAVARGYQDLSDDILPFYERYGAVSKEEIAELYPDLNEEQLETIHDSVIGEARRRERLGNQEQRSRRDINPITAFSGELLGGVSPADVIPIGRGLTGARAIASGAGINAGLDVALQSQDVAYGAQDRYNPAQTAQAAAEGAVLQGVFEGFGRAANWLSNKTRRGVPEDISETQVAQLEEDLTVLEEYGVDTDTLMSPAEVRATVERGVREVANDSSARTADVTARFEESVGDLRRNPDEARAVSESRSQRLAQARRDFQAAGGGEGGYFAHLAALKGKLSRGTTTETIRNKFNQDDIDILYNVLESSPELRGFEQTNAFNGLAKLLGADGATIPTRAELHALQRVFEPAVIRQLMKARPMKEKALDALGNALTLPRTLVSTGDLSAPLRQGGFLIRRKDFWTNLPTMGRVALNEGSYKKMMAEIRERPSFYQMEDAGLAITDMDGPMSMREEDFMSNWGEKIPVAGRVVRGSNRGYSGYLNKLRADTFDSMVSTAARRGNDVTHNPKAMEAIAAYVNSATGRGNLPDVLARYAPALNATLFSPRLISSRLNLLFNPMIYARLPKGVRREALLDLGGYITTASTVLSLAVAAGADVELDPRSSDFLKIRIGNVRYDILGGFQQYLRLFAVLLSGEKKTGRGDIQELGDGFNSPTRLSEITRFLRSKLSPNASYVVDALDGQNIIGDEFSFAGDAAKRMVPLFLQDVAEMSADEGFMGAVKTLPAFFGVGISNYESPNDRYGRSLDEQDQDDPAVQEIDRLSSVLGEGKELIGYVNRGHLTEFEADEDQVKEYQELSGKYILDYLREFQETEEWSLMDDEERIDEVRAIARDMRAQAREELFPRHYGTGEPEEASASIEESSVNSFATQILSNDLGLRITDSGIRPFEEQQSYYDQAGGVGVSTPGTSTHELGNAVDVAVPPSGVTVADVTSALEDQGFRGVDVITRTHGTGPHWHIQWESFE